MKPLACTKTPHRLRRRGVISAELLLVLPIFLVLLLGLFEFSLLFYARSDVVEAARVGARLASLPGVVEDDIREETVRTLPAGLRRQAHVHTALAEHSGDEVAVAVTVPMTAAAPDLLWIVGYSIRNRYLVAESRMVKE